MAGVDDRIVVEAFEQAIANIVEEQEESLLGRSFTNPAWEQGVAGQDVRPLNDNRKAGGSVAAQNNELELKITEGPNLAVLEGIRCLNR